MAPSPNIFIISIGSVDMNKYARFDEIPSMTLKDIRKQNVTDERTDGQRETQIQFAGGTMTNFYPQIKLLCFFLY